MSARKFLNGILFVVGVCLMVFTVTQLFTPHAAGTVVFAALTANLTQAWRERIEAYLNKYPVFLQALTNKHYEGEIKMNATLNIITVGEININTYTGADISFDTMATTGITFTADQKKDFAFQVLDTDMIGSAVKLVEVGSKKAAEALARDVDNYLSGLYSQITTNVYGSNATPIIVGFDKSISEVRPSVALSQLSQLMAVNNADMSNPKIVVPVWLAGYLLQEFGARYTQGGDSAGTAGVSIGKLDLPPVAGFKEIWVSNNVTSVAGAPVTNYNTGGLSYKCMAGTPDSSITFGQALEKVESGRRELNFANYVKGLNVYGSKIPYEGHMGLGTLAQGTPRID